MNKIYYNLAGLILILVFITSCGNQPNQEAEVEVEAESEVEVEVKAEAGYDPEARLAELGITLLAPPQPVANYVNGVRAGNLIFLAGKMKLELTL